MPQNISLNVSPYFDDFDPSKNYQRVLFKPGTPIQARELTTLQSILQNQIEKFGQHFFKEGSMVIPGQIAYDPEYTCVQVNNTHLGIPVSAYLGNFVGKLIKGQTSGVIAKVENFVTNLESDRSTFTLYIKYISSSDDNFITSSFIDGENLISLENVTYPLSAIRANSTFATTIARNSISTGSAAKIVEGVYFIRGFFISVPTQTIILDQYNNLPSYRVGLQIVEEFGIASNNYNDLFDNAQGFSNFAAPGADRLVIKTDFVKKDINDFNDENFIELLRVREGVVEKYVKNTEYNLIKDELARRTYEESGDYYVRPFSISVKECVNDRIGNNGIFLPGERTRQGNVASEDLVCLSVSPGKAYVRGYEIETQNKLLDIEKPRTTTKALNENLQFGFGNQIIVNNAYGSIPLGFTTTSQVFLYDRRNIIPGKSNGSLIGISKVYDYEARSSEYIGPKTDYVVSLYDTQIFTKIKVNIPFNALETPTYIEGRSSGARGFLYQSITNSDELFLYEVSGTFNLNEPIRLDGIDSNRLIISIKDYDIGDVLQIVANENISGVGTFTSDTLLNHKITIGDGRIPFTITQELGNESKLSSSSDEYFTNLEVGNIISYSKQGDVLPTYNRVKSTNRQSGFVVLESVPNIVGVNTGSLPNATIISNDLRKIEPRILNSSSSFYLPLNYKNSSNVDLSNTSIVVKRTFFDINVSTSSFTFILDNDTLSFEAFDEENYNLTYINTGNIVPLKEFENITFSQNRKEVTVIGLTETGPTIFTTTCKINRISTRNKIFNRCSSFIVDKSNEVTSGIGRTTLNDGLEYKKAYGTRVQDREISIGVPEVTNILAIYESSGIEPPLAPRLLISGVSSNILNTIKGEKIIGSISNAVGYFVRYLSTIEIEYIKANENNFLVGEQIIFEESGISAEIDLIKAGDKNITESFDLDSGYREQYIDFSRILRKNNFSIPNKKIRIIYNNYTIPSNDSGDLVSINSYDSDRYKTDLPKTSELIASDYIDFRPAVSKYSGNLSPFEAKSRVFSVESNSTPHILSKNSTVNINYDYYLPRIDKLFLYRDGSFVITKGVPSVNPSSPATLDDSLEIATIKLPAYLRTISDVEIDFNQHKRYTMKDISRLEDRVKNVEYYTLLSLLELDTKNLAIRDFSTGLDRFKSGFFVDNFRDIIAGDLTNPDYRVSIDANNGLMRPTHYTTALDLIPGSNRTIGLGVNSPQTVDLKYSLDLGTNNLRKVNDIVCLNYTEVEYVKNLFATRIENINPFNVINWVGTVEFNPSSDSWVETRKIGNKVLGTFEGDYLDAIRRLNIDTNTGLSPVEWGAWETIWTGVSVSRDSTIRGRKLITTTTNTTFVDQQRLGTQYKVSEKIDTLRLGDKVVSTSSINYMRSRNIEIIARRLKPNTRVYTFFDDINVTQYIVPKLIEVSMESGTFIEGEVVTGILGSKQIRFRLARQNHKFGPVDDATSRNLPPNYPVEVYRNNLYNPDNSLPSIYSATSTVLNVDTASLEINGVSEFFGCIAVGMKLVGQGSQATAMVSNLRLISDDYGTFIGSLFIPDPTVPSTPVFETGTKSFTITTNSANSQIYGFNDSSGIGNFTSSGILENVESNTLRIRNSNIETIERQNERTLSNTQTTTIIRHTDPLAQSFLVEDRNGVCITKCDIFFRSKDSSNIPVTIQIRTVELGLPTQTILPFGEVTINPNQVKVSEDGSIPTTFYFESPIYLESNNQYALVLLSASNEYNVWISRVGETEVSTLNLSESDRVIVSQQPLLGSLFKSQNGSTWDPSQYEDLKFVLYRANFTSNEGTMRFYNPDLNIGNNQIVSLSNNPIYAYSKILIAGIGKSFTQSDINLLTPGATITQTNNDYFRSNLVSVVGSVGIGSTLVVTDVGTGFGNTTTIFQNVRLAPITGIGQGAIVNIGVISGIANTVTVVDGGRNYIVGDVLSIDTNDTNGLGRDLIVSIPNDIGIITSFNSVLLQNIQGDLIIDTTSDIISNGTTLTSAPVPEIPITLTDGLHFRVVHNNHGMYSQQNFVTLSGIEPDLPPIKLTSNINSTTTEIQLTSVGILTTFENIPVDADNPGYILVNNEIIKYTGVDMSSNSLTGVTRFDSNTITSSDQLLKISYYPQTHRANDDVFKYEFNGISLRRINTTHNLNEVNSNIYPTTLDSYHIKVNMAGSGSKDRSSNSGTRPLFFNSTKFGGSFLTDRNQSNTVTGPKATQNICMTSIRPNIQTLTPKTTDISARIRTVSGTSVSGNEASFIDKGFEALSLNSNNFFSDPRIICSKINESTYLDFLPGNKSFTMEFTLRTNDRKVSPMIDLDRVNLIATMNRLDNPVTNYALDERVNELYNDPHSSVYVSRLVKLTTPADSLKVIFDAYRHSSSDIRVAYRIIREDIPMEQQVYELFPGYKNIDNNKNVIDPSKNDGSADYIVASSSNINDYKPYEFTANNLPEFSGFQIKVMISGTNQADVPLIKDFRAISTI